jgi:hypothetical protein
MPFAFTKFVVEQVGGNAAEPASELNGFLEAADIAIHPNPDFLGQVSAIIPIGGKVIEDSIYVRLVATHQLRKTDTIGTLTVRLAKYHKLVVGKFMGWYLH